MQNSIAYLLLPICLLAACQASPAPNGQPPAAPASPAPVSSSNPTGTGSPQPGSAGLNPASPATPPAGVPASAFPSGPPATPAQVATIASLGLSVPQRFLTEKGQSTRLVVELRDASGNPLALNVPLEWLSSRPGDFSVDANGLVTALKEDGFAEITVKIPGTDFTATGLISVVSDSNGGGGGGASGPVNARPVIASLSASSEAVLGYGIPVELRAAASDADGPDPLVYSWRCSGECGTFSAPTGDVVYWFTPAADGEYDLRLTVSDGRSSVSQSVTVAVTGGSSTVDVDGELEDDD